MNSSADLAIRARRADFNHALAEQDLASIGPILALKTVMITGTDSAVLSGRKAQLLAWKQEFAADDRTVYTRTPQDITVSDVEPVAMEMGHWDGVSAVAGQSIASGTYSAKWRKLGDDWVIEAEIYLTLA